MITQKTDLEPETLEDAKLSEAKTEILTESDKILENFRQELFDINLRLKELEEEKVEFQKMMKDTHQTVEKSFKLLNLEKKRADGKKEDFKVVEQLFQELKQPINAVVESLDSLQAEIEDPSVKDSIQECFDTAKSVLQMFNSSQQVVVGLAEPKVASQESFLIREVLKEQILKLQAEALPEVHMRLFVDSKIPETVSNDPTFLKRSLAEVLPPLFEKLTPTNSLHLKLVLKSLAEDAEKDHMVLEIYGAEPLAWSLHSAWDQNFSLEPEKTSLPLSWINLRSDLRESYGDLAVELANDQLTKIELWLPYQPNLNEK